MINKELKKYLIALKKNLFKDLDIFFASIPNEILAKKDFIEYAIQITPKAYIYASQEIRENKEILLKVFEDGELDTVYIPDSLIND